ARRRRRVRGGDGVPALRGILTGLTGTGRDPVYPGGMARIRTGDDAPPAAMWLRNFRLSGFAITVLVLVAAAIVILAPSLKTFVEQRQQIAQLEREVEEAEQELGRLEEEL